MKTLSALTARRAPPIAALAGARRIGHHIERGRARNKHLSAWRVMASFS